MRHIFGPTIIVAPPINNHPRLGLQVQPSTLPLTDTFFWLDLSPIMGRALKRALHLRELNNARKISKLRPEPKSEPEPEPTQEVESDQETEIEELPITLPDLPILEDESNDPKDDALIQLQNTTKGLDWKDTHISYQRTHQPSRQTLWRQQQRKHAFQTAAAGSRDIRSMFNDQPSITDPLIVDPPIVASLIESPPSKPSKSEILAKAILELEKFLGYNRASRKFEQALNSQTRERHRAILHFLYLQRKNPEATRRDLSLQVAQSFNRGKYFSECLVTWERMWIRGEGIPMGRQGCHTKLSSLFNDEEVQLFVREFISSKKEEITSSLLAQAVTEFVGSREMGAHVQASLELVEAEREDEGQQKRPSSLKARAARMWLNKMGYSWRSAKKGVYIDGHEREDVVQYRQEVFLPTIQAVRSRLATWDDDGNVVKEGVLPEEGRWVVIVTHDESTFNANDGRRQLWLQDKENPLRPKGNGKGIMVSEFLTPRGRLQVPTSISDQQLKASNLQRYATETFEYGDNKYWNSEMLAHQTLQVAIPLFEAAFPPGRFQGLFLFDNATSHNVMASDALDVRKMNLGPGGKQPVMRDGWNPRTNAPQAMNENGIPKGIRTILKERGLWPVEGIRLQCTKAIKREDGRCCARHLLGSQPDFSGQRGLLQEEIEKRGHLVTYYPKYHPELNFIEYFWGYCKRFTRENCTYTLAGLRRTVPNALAAVPMDTIRKFYEKSVRIADAYRDGHHFGTKEFTDRVYKSHRRAE